MRSQLQDINLYMGKLVQYTESEKRFFEDSRKIINDSRNNAVRSLR